jgi:hypothetical protein
MQLLHHDAIETRQRGVNHRVGSFIFKDLGSGRPGSPDNFLLRLVTSGTDFFSPRHMHNFDQVRVQIQGRFAFDADGVMDPGSIGYFPEGTAYGPQTSRDDTVQLVMQIGGASGNGYLSESERVAAVEALASQGEFRGGHYYRSGSEQGMDGFQAAWEQAQGRAMVYPPQRLQRPLLVDPQAFEWLPCAMPGVEEKTIVNFGRRTVGVRLVRVAAGARCELTGPLSCFWEQGGGDCEAGGRRQPCGRFDTLHLAHGESSTLHAAQPSRLIVFTHPVFDAAPTASAH